MKGSLTTNRKIIDRFILIVQNIQHMGQACNGQQEPQGYRGQPREKGAY